MAANPNPPLDPESDMEIYHEYHAEGHVLSGRGAVHQPSGSDGNFRCELYSFGRAGDACARR